MLALLYLSGALRRWVAAGLLLLGGWGGLSAALADSNEPWRAPASARSRRNPLPASASPAGATLFAANCAACHGPGGRGDGLSAAALNPLPRDLTSPAVQRESDGALFWKTIGAPGGIPVPIANNSTVVLYASFALRQYWTFALEAQGARTERALVAALPSVYSAVYDGRLLFGQKYAF